MKRYIKSDTNTSITYQDIYKNVFQTEHLTKKSSDESWGYYYIEMIASYVWHYKYDKVKTREEAVYDAMDLYEAMTGKSYDPTQDEFDDMVYEIKFGIID